MKQVLGIAKRKTAKVSVLFIDLDKFKQVNDLQGHEAGDWLLQQVAQRMQSVLRESDTAARVGGDEFVVLLSDVGNVKDAVSVAEKIRLEMEKPFIMGSGVKLEISSSIGVVMYPDQADNPLDLLRYGDEAMYRAKKKGRNAVEVFA
jgi:diguanylate cyclase (GGDEF)-like protein